MSVYTRKNKRGIEVWFTDFTWVNPNTGKTQRVRKPCKDEYRRPTRSRTASEAFENRLRAQLVAGVGPDIPESLTASTGLTLKDFWVKYSELHVSRYKPSAKAATETIFKVHVLPNLGEKALDDIGESDLAQLASNLRTKGKAAKTINNVVSGFRTSLAIANDWGDRTLPPPKVKWERRADIEIEHFGTAEINKLVEVQDPMVTVAVKTGLRLGELLSLRWSDIRDNKITVSRSVWWKKGVPYEGATKSNRIRVVPLPPSAIEALNSIGRLSEFVFTGPEGERLTRYGVQHRIWWACAKAGLERCSWHKLRHSYISELVRLGVPLPQVQQLAGHSQISMTMRYTHVTSGDLANAIIKLT